jgi:hypothetical protein
VWLGGIQREVIHVLRAGADNILLLVLASVSTANLDLLPEMQLLAALSVPVEPMPLRLLKCVIHVIVGSMHRLDHLVASTVTLENTLEIKRVIVYHVQVVNIPHQRPIHVLIVYQVNIPPVVLVLAPHVQLAK